MPLPPSVRRPFALIGASVALVFLAAVFDAVLWHYSLERDELRGRALQAEQRVLELESQLRASQIELIKHDFTVAPSPCPRTQPADAPGTETTARVTTGRSGKR
jgi:hypothetical protein